MDRIKRGVHQGCSVPDDHLVRRHAGLHWKLELFARYKVKMTLLFLFAALTASAQNKTENLPVTDAEKIADALRAAPAFITADATIVDHPVSKGDEWRVLRKGSSEWTCMPGPPPGSKHDDPGCFDKVFFQFVKDVLAGRPQHVERLGVAYMYTGHTVPGASGEPFRVGAHIMVVSPHPDELQGFIHGGWNGTYAIHLPGGRTARPMVFGNTD